MAGRFNNLRKAMGREEDGPLGLESVEDGPRQSLTASAIPALEKLGVGLAATGRGLSDAVEYVDNVGGLAPKAYNPNINASSGAAELFEAPLMAMGLPAKLAKIEKAAHVADDVEDVAKLTKPTTYYHGTGVDIDQFKPSRDGLLGEGVYLSNDPNFSDKYAYNAADTDYFKKNPDYDYLSERHKGRIYPVEVSGEDKIFNDSGTRMDNKFERFGLKSKEDVAEGIREAGSENSFLQKLGYTGKRHDISPKEIVVFDPENIQSVFKQKAQQQALLDMSKDARMQRAKELGFDTDRVLYHGTNADIEEFRPSTGGSLLKDDKGVYLTPDPEVANNYADPEIFKKGSNVLPVLGRGKILQFDGTAGSLDHAKQLGFNSVEDYRAAIQSAGGYEQLLKKLGYDGRESGKQLVVFDPKNIRSVNAAFDPTKANSKNILAGGVAGAVANEAMDEDSEQFQTLKRYLKGQ